MRIGVVVVLIDFKSSASLLRIRTVGRSVDSDEVTST